jgi:hypothetical protein
MKTKNTTQTEPDHYHDIATPATLCQGRDKKKDERNCWYKRLDWKKQPREQKICRLKIFKEKKNP